MPDRNAILIFRCTEAPKPSIPIRAVPGSTAEEVEKDSKLAAYPFYTIGGFDGHGAEKEEMGLIEEF